jgi:hypothetical protein
MAKTNQIEVPSWYPLPVYNRELTPEEWLHEIFKRSELNNTLAYPFLTQQESLEIFNAVILKDEIPDIRSILQGKHGQPIRDLSIAESLYITELIKQDKSYRDNPDTIILESAIKARVGNIPLTNEQRDVFGKYHDIPWHSFRAESNNHRWYPRIPYLIGAPVTINAFYFKTDILSELRKLLTRWITPKRAISKKVFSTWTEKKILAIFDLRIWYKLYGITIPKIELARILWPNPPPSKKKKHTTVYLEDYIDMAIDLSDKNIHQGNVSMLFQTCESRKYLQEKQENLKKSIKNNKMKQE